MAKLVTVYSPDGTAEQHTIPNARDLVQAGWSYVAGRKVTPFDSLPQGIALTASQIREKEKTKIAHEIWERVPSDSDAETMPTVEDEDEVVPPTAVVIEEPLIVPAEFVVETDVVAEKAPVVEAAPEPAAVDLPRAGKPGRRGSRV